jgi:hypothetical protein
MVEGPQREFEEQPAQPGIGRFVLGALATVFLAAAFLYADGYFDDNPLVTPTAGEPAIGTTEG